MASSEEHARGLQARGVGYLQEYVAGQPSRRAYQFKDPRGYAEFRRQIADHSALGSALTQLGIQRKRPTVMQLGDQLQRLRVPTLLMIGDQDEPCVDANVFMSRQCATAGLVVLPRTGHTVNLEEPDLFNDIVLRFLNSVEANRWLPDAAHTAT